MYKIARIKNTQTNEEFYAAVGLYDNGELSQASWYDGISFKCDCPPAVQLVRVVDVEGLEAQKPLNIQSSLSDVLGRGVETVTLKMK